MTVEGKTRGKVIRLSINVLYFFLLNAKKREMGVPKKNKNTQVTSDNFKVSIIAGNSLDNISNMLIFFIFLSLLLLSI